MECGERDTCLSPLARMCVESYRLVVSSQQRKKGPDENEERNHVNGRIASSLEERCVVKIALIFRPERKVLQITFTNMQLPGLCDTALLQLVRVQTSAENLHSSREALCAGSWPHELRIGVFSPKRKAETCRF